MSRNTLETRLSKLTNANLAVLYNSVAERKISKFSDHTTAVKRTLAAMTAAGRDFTMDGEELGKIVDAGSATPPTARGARGDDSRGITVLADSNPKAIGSKSHARFALYAKSATVGDYIAAASGLGGGRRKAVRDLTWDEAHGYIKIG